MFFFRVQGEWTALSHFCLHFAQVALWLFQYENNPPEKFQWFNTNYSSSFQINPKRLDTQKSNYMSLRKFWQKLGFRNFWSNRMFVFSEPTLKDLAFCFANFYNFESKVEVFLLVWNIWLEPAKHLRNILVYWLKQTAWVSNFLLKIKNNVTLQQF